MFKDFTKKEHLHFLIFWKIRNLKLSRKYVCKKNKLGSMISKMNLICPRLLQQDGSISSAAAWLHDAITVRSAGVQLWMPVKILLEYVIFDCCSVIYIHC